jgi:transposase
MPGEGPGVLARRALQGGANCEAVQRPNMRFVPVKSEAAQARLAVHTVRQGLVAGRTATINRLRGVLSEFGQVMPLKARTVRLEAATPAERLPQWAQTGCMDLLAEIRRHGWAWCPANTARAARTGSATSRRPVTVTCARC